MANYFDLNDQDKDLLEKEIKKDFLIGTLIRMSYGAMMGLDLTCCAVAAAIFKFSPLIHVCVVASSMIVIWTFMLTHMSDRRKALEKKFENILKQQK